LSAYTIYVRAGIDRTRIVDINGSFRIVDRARIRAGVFQRSLDFDVDALRPR
jgi:hypothetical protein